MKPVTATLATLIATLLLAADGACEVMADAVLVDKSERRLYLLRDGEVIESFPATFGTNPKGHKQQEGDGRTPEGHYTLDWKFEGSDYHKAIHVSYPDNNDTERASEQGISPGGAIMVHGQKNGYSWLAPLARYVNWTDGCIALRNTHMDIVWDKVDPGTPIEIRP